MASQVSLRVQYTDGGAEASLVKITKLADGLDGRQVSLKVDTASMEKLNGVTAKQAREYKTAADAANKTAVAQAKVSTEISKQELNAARASKANAQHSKSLDGVADSSKKAGDSLVQSAGKLATWMLLGNVISGVKRAFTDALGEMKNVDTELVEVRKVTGLTTQELAGLRDRAYEVGSALGKSASEYLNSAAEFARAGYSELSGDLAELAMKTQLVGDVDAETANQFLLSVDAAYQYHGSISELTKVLDGANEIDNKFATSIQKITEGLGKVAPIAAMAHVEIGELSAAIGTITAVTQRSGTEAATALRAIFMNIMGRTTTYQEDGIDSIEENVIAMLDLIKKYAPQVYEEARKAGEAINPMEGIEGLAKAYQEGFLTEEAILSKSMELGGKLRTTQLVALIKNWGMYKDMLVAFGGAAGSADREVANALDSWTVKSQRLSNSWTELISHLIDTGTVKGSLDILNAGVELLDSGLGKAIITGAAFFAMLSVGAKIVSSLKTSFSGIGIGTFGWIGIAVAGITLLYNVIDSLVISFDDLKKDAEEAQKTYEEEASKLDSINTELETQKKRMEELQALGKLSYVDQTEYDLLVKSTEQLQIQADLQKKAVESAQKAAALAQSKVVNAYSAYDSSAVASYVSTAQITGNNAILTTDDKDLNAMLAARIQIMGLYNESLREGGEDSEYFRDWQKELEDQIWAQVTTLQTAKDSMQEYYNAIKDIPYSEMSNDQRLVYNAYTMAAESIKQIYKEIDPLAFARIWGESGTAAQSSSSAIEESTTRIDQHAQNIQTATDKYKLLIQAQKEQNETGKISEGTYQALKVLYGDQIDGLEELSDGALITADGYKKLTDEQKAYLESWGYEFPADNAVSEATTALNELGDALDQARKDKSEFDKAMSGSKQGTAFDDYAEAYKTYQNEVKSGRTNSDTFWAAAGFLLGDDQLNTILTQAGTIEEAISKIQEKLGKKSYYDEIFKSGEDDGQGFLKVLDKLADKNGVVADGLATIKKDGKGAYTFDIPLENYGKLAEYLGISEEQIAAILDSLNMYGPILEMSEKDLESWLEKSGVVIKKLGDGTKVININDLVKQLKEAGIEASGVAQIVQKLANTDGITLVNDDGTTVDPADTLTDIGTAAGGAQTPVDDLGTSLDGVGTSSDDAGTKAGNLKTAIEALGDVSVTPEINTSWLNLAANLTKKIIDRLNEMNGKTYTTHLTVDDGTPDKGGNGGNSSGGGYTGIDSFAGGEVLVNDGAPVNGSTGELIQQGKRSFIVNNGKPARVKLGAGARIYNARETQDILHPKGETYEMPSFAGGTVVFPATPTKPGGGSGTGSGSSNTTPSAAASSAAQDNWQAIMEYLNYSMQLIELKISQKQKEIDAITKIRDAMTAPIKEQISDLEWAVETYGHEISMLERARDAVTKPIDEQIEALKAAHDQEEKTFDLEKARAALQNAQNERNVRVFNKTTGQWEWQANAENVKNAQESYDDALYEAQISDLETKKAEASKVYDDQIKLLENQKTITEGQIDDLNYTVNSITESYKDTLTVLEGEKAVIKEQYDAFKEQMELINLALSEPTENLQKAIDALAKSGIPGIANIVSALNGLLGDLTKNIGISIGNVQTPLTPSTAAQYLTQTSFSKGDNGSQVAYLQQALIDLGYKLGATGVSGKYDAATIKAIKTIQKLLGVKQTGYAGEDVIKYIKEKLLGSSYDHGGVADGTGLMVKATNDKEGVIEPDIMNLILNPKKNARFEKFSNSLGVLLNGIDQPASTVGYLAQAQKQNATEDHRVYINGVKIGSDMMHRPLSDTLSALGIHCGS